MSVLVARIKRRLKPLKPYVLRIEALRFPVFGLILLVAAGYILTRKPGDLETNVMYLHSQVQLLFLATVNLLAVAITVVIARRLLDRHMDSSLLIDGEDYQLSPWPLWLYFLCSLGAMLTPVAALSFSVEQGGLRAVFGQSENAVLQPSSTDTIERVQGAPEEVGARTAKAHVREKLSEPEPLDGYTMFFVSLVCACLGVIVGWGVLWGLEWLTVHCRRLLKRKFQKGYYFPFSQSVSGGRAADATRSPDDFDLQLLIYLLFLIGFLWTGFGSSLLEPLSSVAALIVLAILVVTMSLSGLSALLAPWRISVLFVFLLWIAVAKIVTSPHRDQLMPIGSNSSGEKGVGQKQQIGPPSASNVSYVVTCPGGGIHASAWSYFVLSELHRHEGFRKNLRFISAISGGSVGAAFYLKETLANADDQVEDPANGLHELTIPNGGLDEIGRGLLHGDIRNVLFPFLPTHGRGRLLEDYLEQYFDGAQLDQWEELAREGKMPVVCFGAMDVLSGKRAVMHTGMEFSDDTLALQLKDLLGPNKTVRVSSAIRTSAAFPYVSPLVGASPDGNESQQEYEHDDRKDSTRYALGDGGYIDNEGIISAIEWIIDFRAKYQPQSDSQQDVSASQVEDELQAEAAEKHAADSARDTKEKGTKSVHTIYLIRIQPYQPALAQTATSLDEPEENGENRRVRKFDFGESLRWIAGPLQALASMRTASQLERGNLEVAQLADVLSEEAAGSNVVVKVVSVPYACDDKRFEPPLSWVLTPRQAQQYAPAWDRNESSILTELGLSGSIE